MEPDYYREYYFMERHHWWFKAREHLLESWINHILKEKIEDQVTQLQVLNVGAATGRSSEWLANYGDVTSVEYDQDCCFLVHKQSNMPLVSASICDLPFADEKFDLVCAFDVLEHVKDDVKAAAELMRVCKSDGIVLVTVPAWQFLWSSHDVINHHFRRYRLYQLSNIFSENNNGKVTHKSYFNFWLFPAIALNRGIRRVAFKFGWGVVENEAKSDFQKSRWSFSGRIFYHIFRSETVLLRLHLSLPFGVSAMLTWRRCTLDSPLE